MSMTSLVLLLVLCALPARMADRPLQKSSAVAVDSRSHFTTARDHRGEHTGKSHHTNHHTNHHTAASHGHSTSELHDDVIASAHRATVAAENRTSHHTMTLHNELESHQGKDGGISRISASDWDAAFSKVDADGDGEVTFAEFQKFFGHLVSKDKFKVIAGDDDKIDKAEWSAVFLQVDSDNNGSVDKTEFNDFFGCNNCNGAYAVMHSMHPDGDDSSPAPFGDRSPAQLVGVQPSHMKADGSDLATAAIGTSGKASCPCIKNNRPKVDCHSPLAIDGKCVEATDAGQSHDDGFLAVDYGEECRAHIDPKWGECSDPATEMPWKQSCKEAPDLEEKMQCRHDFCDLLFCFVDPAHCDVFHRESGRWGGIRYSYATCGHSDQPRVPTKKKDEESISSRAALSALSFLVVVAWAF